MSEGTFVHFRPASREVRKPPNTAIYPTAASTPWLGWIMRTDTLEPFTVGLYGTEGPYSVRFVPDAQGREGHLMVRTGDVWRHFGSVELIERRATGELLLSGMGGLSDDDTYWYELIAEPVPPRITYWGDRVIHRIDTGDAA